jgi:hypothetical protein
MLERAEVWFLEYDEHTAEAISPLAVLQRGPEVKGSLFVVTNQSKTRSKVRPTTDPHMLS